VWPIGTARAPYPFMPRLTKWLMICLGILLLIIGLLTFPLPLPIGLPILLVGITLLLRYSSEAKRLLLRLSKRHPPLRGLLDRLRSKHTADPVEDRVD